MGHHPAGRDQQTNPTSAPRSRLRRMGVRTKLFLVSLMVILVVGLASGVYLEFQMHNWIGARVETELLRHIQTAKALVEDRLAADKTDFDGLADRLGPSTASRVTIIARNGRVVGDSKLTPEQIKVLENHSQRPEVRAALASGLGINRRFSTTLDTNMLYVAMPLSTETHGWVLRVSRPLEAVDRGIRDLHWHLLIAGILGLAIAIFMSALASHFLTRALRALVRNAPPRTGRAEPGDNTQPGDEIEGLAGSFDELAKQLEVEMGRLAQERDLSHAILECMGEALFALNDQHRVMLVNQAALDLLRLDHPPFGAQLTAITGIAELEQTLNQARNGQVVSTEFSLVSPRYREILARAAPLRLRGGSVVVMHDVTELRRMEKSLRDFVANASHELRTPVSVIRANAETLIDGAIDNPRIARQLVETLERNTHRLVNIVADLLDLSRLDAYQHELDSAPLDLSHAVNAAMEALSPLANEKQIDLSADVPPNIKVLADPKALDQILLNLLDNALKYTPAGGKVTVRAEETGREIQIQVIDSGPGIALEHRKRLFERFYRVDTARSREGGGTGLGLAIVKKLAEALDGRVGMEPREPQGSMFWVQLPKPE